jgi:putative transposase
MPDVFLSLHCHVVFGTKDGQASLGAAMAERLADQFEAIAADQETRILAVGVMPDHVHLLAALGRLTSIDDLVRALKNRSADWIRDTLPNQGRFAWQSGYGAFAVSFSRIERVRRYIVEQEPFHRQRTFQQEFITLLRRHEMAHDDHFYWW